MVVIIFLVVLILTGLLLTTWQVLLVLRLLGRTRQHPVLTIGEKPLWHESNSGFESERTGPLVSILKPISGLEDEIEENLLSFSNLQGISHEIILSVADPDDPVLDVIARIRPRFYGAKLSVVIGGGGGTPNPKVERLVAAARRSRGRILFISDSNIRVSPCDIAATVAAFRDPEVGCVSNLFVGEGARTLGAVIESLHLISFVLPGCVFANWARVPCLVGKSMAISRAAYEAIGGFEAFGNVLAEDQAMAIAIKRAGYKLELSSTAVRNVIVGRSLRGALGRQVRWNKIRYAFSKLAYTSEFLVNPFPLSLLLCAAACLLLKPPALHGVLTLAAFTSAVRFLQELILIRATAVRSIWRQVLLAPLQDLLQFAAQFSPYFSNEVNWRGHRARLGRGSAMLMPKSQATPGALGPTPT
jgi:ceramide glucosyltransferase